LPEREDDEEQIASPDPDEASPWEPEPYDPEREYTDPGLPAAVP
jgi:hypothetical protein